MESTTWPDVTMHEMQKKITTSSAFASVLSACALIGESKQSVTIDIPCGVFSLNKAKGL